MYTYTFDIMLGRDCLAVSMFFLASYGLASSSLWRLLAVCCCAGRPVCEWRGREEQQRGVASDWCALSGGASCVVVVASCVVRCVLCVVCRISCVSSTYVVFVVGRRTRNTIILIQNTQRTVCG